MKTVAAVRVCAVLAGCTIGSLGLAASPPSVAKPAGAAEVELFAAMKSGDIEVKVIPKDSTAGAITIANKTKKPLTIKLPEVFASIPVAAQFGGAGGGGNNDGGNNQNQGMGGGGMMGGGMMGGGMGGGGGGFFNVAPEKVGKLKFVGVCLEHGKKDPNPRVPYTIVPLESFNNDPKVAETLKMLGRREIDQHSAQAAAWHLANGLSWDELARKVGAKHIGGRTDPYFTALQLQFAMKIADEAGRRADAASKSSPGESSAGSSGSQASPGQQ